MRRLRHSSAPRPASRRAIPLPTRLLPIVLGALVALTACTCDSPRDAGWWSELPELEPPAEWSPGLEVWATLPGAVDGTAELGLFRLAAPPEGVEPSADAILVGDDLGRTHRTPAALVHPVEPPAGIEAGAVVLAYHATAGPVLARLRSVDPVEVSFDWNGVTVTDSARAVVSPRQGLPRAVLFHTGERWLAGVVMAEHGERVWVLDEAGHVHGLAADGVEPREPVAAPAPGTAVQVYTWAEGLRPAEVLEELEPGLRYRVGLVDAAGPGSPDRTRMLAFDSLLSAPPPRPATEGP